MDQWVEDGFTILGGPVEGEKETVHVIDAPSEKAIQEKFAEDNWTANGMLATKSIERWTVLLDGRDRR